MAGIKLGQQVRDVVTGFVGIADSRTEWLNGCVRVGVQPPMKKDFVPESKVFDEEQLEIVVEEPIILPKHRSKATQTGGGRPNLPARGDPR